MLAFPVPPLWSPSSGCCCFVEQPLVPVRNRSVVLISNVWGKRLVGALKMRAALGSAFFGLVAAITAQLVATRPLGTRCRPCATPSHCQGWPALVGCGLAAAVLRARATAREAGCWASLLPRAAPPSHALAARVCGRGVQATPRDIVLPLSPCCVCTVGAALHPRVLAGAEQAYEAAHVRARGAAATRPPCAALTRVRGHALPHRAAH
jgi:hypothetical protein